MKLAQKWDFVLYDYVMISIKHIKQYIEIFNTFKLKTEKMLLYRA
jgi:hypothetical protein